jgi:hypothetical protein
MKSIKNEGIQGVQILISTPRGPEWQYLPPKKTIVVQDSYITKQAQNLHVRRKIKIANFVE